MKVPFPLLEKVVLRSKKEGVLGRELPGVDRENEKRTRKQRWLMCEISALAPEKNPQDVFCGSQFL